MVGVIHVLTAVVGVVAIVQMDEVLARTSLAFGPDTETTPPAWFVAFARVVVAAFVLLQLRFAFLEYL